jgi:peptide-methionine (S)-S-oxide reductase
MGDHTESFQVDFDPAVISYEQLLDLFWASHNPFRSAWKTQYASLVLASNDAQLAAAKQSAVRLEATKGHKIATRIEPLGEFWLAEGYHQKYYLQNSREMGRFSAKYPDLIDFVNSTEAARANGQLGRRGSCSI